MTRLAAAVALASLFGLAPVSRALADGCEDVDCSVLDDGCSMGVCVDGGCQTAPRQAGAACDDGNACTVGDVCDAQGVCAGEPVRTNLDVIDFDSEPTGEIVSTIYGAGGYGPIQVHGNNPRFAPGTNASLIYDSSCPGGCTGEDPDLGTPNQDFGGPGVGAGGAAGGRAPNTTPLNKVLVIANGLEDNDGDGLVDEPDDESAFEVSHHIDFSAIGPVTILGATAIDVETDEGRPTLQLFDGGSNLLATFDLPRTGDNGVTPLTLEGIPGVSRIVITVDGSAAVDNIRFRTGCEVPECFGDEDCDEGERCNANGTCTEPGGPCETDDDCVGGQVCDEETGTCEEPECRSDEDCPEGQICNLETGECEEEPGCTSDDDCPEGQVCNVNTGICREPGGPCIDSTDCADLDSFCTVGVCDDTQTCIAMPVNEGETCQASEDVCIVESVCVDGGCLPVPLCDPVCELCDAGDCQSLCGNPWESVDSGITITDGLYTLRSAVELEQCALCVCDVNNDGQITAVDALVIARIVVRLPAPLDCPGPVVTSTTSTSTTSTSTTSSTASTTVEEGTTTTTMREDVPVL